MKTQKILIAFALVASLILAGCTSSKEPGVSLDETSWVLAALNGQAVMSEAQVTLNFTKGTVNGSDGCNSYSSTYTVEGSKLSIGKEIISTLMACSDPIMQQAGAYTTALVQVASYQVDGEQLSLLDAGGKTLATFKK